MWNSLLIAAKDVIASNASLVFCDIFTDYVVFDNERSQRNGPQIHLKSVSVIVGLVIVILQ